MSSQNGGEKTQQSRIRSILADERTFAAWIRTGVSLVLLGLAIGRFLATRNNPYKIWFLGLGAAYIFCGIGLLVFALIDYYQRRKEIARTDYEAPKRILVVISGGLVLITAVLMVILMLDMAHL